MPFELELRHEGLNYTGQYLSPALDLWGSGGLIVKGLLKALGPHGVTLQQIQVSGGPQNASETLVTAIVPGVGPVKFAFDKLEFNFANFSREFFEAIPKTMGELVAWLKRDVREFKFATHHFTYFCHSFVKESTPQEVLKAVNPRELKSVGISMGNGAIFNQTVPSKNWEIQLIVDKSRHLVGGLFISLDLAIGVGEIDYEQVVSEGRKYLADALAELNLFIPEASK